MNISRVLVAITLIPFAVAAQQVEPFAGKWSGTVVGGNGAELALEVSISGASGTYRILPRGTQARNNPCFGKEFPVQVTSQTEAELKFEVKQSSVLPGCPDQSVTLRNSGAKSLEGTTADGRAVKLSR